MPLGMNGPVPYVAGGSPTTMAPQNGKSATGAMAPGSAPRPYPGPMPPGGPMGMGGAMRPGAAPMVPPARPPMMGNPATGAGQAAPLINHQAAIATALRNPGVMPR